MAIRVEPVQGVIRVAAASTGNLTLSGAQTVDGVSVVGGMLVLAKDQSTGAEKGVYLASSSGAWVMADPGPSDGLMISVVAGTTNADTTWRVTNDITWGSGTPTFENQTGGTGAGGMVTLTGSQTLTNKKLSTGTTIGVAPSFDKEANYSVSVAATTTAATAGGNLGIAAGAGNTTGAGGAASLTGGAGGNDAVGGSSSLVAGAAGGGNRAGGAALVTGGAGSGSAAGGAVTVAGGVGGATGAGGSVNISGGAGGATSGAGGAVVLAGGAGSAGNANGGALSIRGGAKNGSGTDGAVVIGDSNTASVTIGAAGVPFSLGRGTVSQATNINTDVTCNANSGVITTQSASTAAATMESGFTLNNSCISATSVVTLQIVGYSGTHITNGIPYLAVAAPGSGTVAIKIGNIHAANALSGTMKIHFIVA